MNQERQVKISKFLSKHLRHTPERLGLVLAPGGWIAVDELLGAFDTPRSKETRILASSVLSRNLNTSIQISPFGYVHKLTRTSRPRLKRFLISVFTPTFVQDLGFILPGFRIRSSPLDLLRLLFVRFTAISYTTTKAALEGRGFKPSFSVNLIDFPFPMQN